MKVLTIREPWASLIGVGIKKIETRSWYTSYRGELFIHAGKYPVSQNDETVKKYSKFLLGKEYMYGKIFLKCNLVDCIEITNEYANRIKNEDRLNYEAGDYEEGRFAWVLKDVEYIEPINAIGHLSIWTY